MQEIDENGATIDVCTSCRGTFLDRGEGAHFVEDGEKLEGLLAQGLSEAQTGHPCPRCGGVMTEGALGDAGYRIEHCSGCGGIWFASRQLSRLRAIVADAKPPKTKKSKHAPVVSKRNAQKHRCPSCHAPATTHDRWTCDCGWVWDAFTTHGVCPKCNHRWTKTRCPRCGESTPHEDWYEPPG